MGSDTSLIGQKALSVVVRGVKIRWKQINGCHITRKEKLDPQLFGNFLLDCIQALQECGLRVIAFSSDMDGRNKAFLNLLNISVSQMEASVNSFFFNGNIIYVFPNICH